MAKLIEQRPFAWIAYLASSKVRPVFILSLGLVMRPDRRYRLWLGVSLQIHIITFHPSS